MSGRQGLSAADNTSLEAYESLVTRKTESQEVVPFKVDSTVPPPALPVVLPSAPIEIAERKPTEEDYDGMLNACREMEQETKRSSHVDKGLLRDLRREKQGYKKQLAELRAQKKAKANA